MILISFSAHVISIVDEVASRSVFNPAVFSLCLGMYCGLLFGIAKLLLFATVHISVVAALKKLLEFEDI